MSAPTGTYRRTFGAATAGMQITAVSATTIAVYATLGLPSPPAGRRSSAANVSHASSPKRLLVSGQATVAPYSSPVRRELANHA